MKRHYDGSGSSHGAYGDHAYRHSAIMSEKDTCNEWLAKAVSEHALPRAQELILKKLIEEVFEAKDMLKENGGVLRRITELEASNDRLISQVEHLNARLSQELDELHLKVQHLERTVTMLHG
jgi:predicted nuclease with TOPRIM domain